MQSGINDRAQPVASPSVAHPLAFTALVAMACAGRFALRRYAFHDFVDDAYIYLRYCENWSSGLGLVYNSGERVIAFTSYLYVILVAGFIHALPGIAATTLVTVFNITLFAGFCVIIYHFLDPARFLYWATAIFLFFYFPFVDATVSGMESTLFLTVIAGTLLAIRKKRFVLAIPLAAIAAVTRPEGAMLLIAVCGVSVVSLSRFDRARAIACALGILGIILLPIYLYYGTILPQSMLAKSSQVTESSWGGIPTTPLVKGILVAFGMSDSFFLGLPQYVRLAFIATFAILLVAFASAVVRAWLRHDRAIPVAAAFYLLVVAFYVVGNPVRIFSWYTIAPAMCFTLVCIYGIEEMVTMREWRVGTRLRIVLALGACSVSGLSIVLAAPARIQSVEEHVGELSSAGQRIEHDYIDAQSLMIADIGIIGYTTNLRIIDLAGLVSRVSVAEENGHKNSFGRIVELTDPDIVCLKHNPIRNESINESSLIHRSFDSEKQKDEFVHAYTPIDLNSGGCHFGYAKKDLARR